MSDVEMAEASRASNDGSPLKPASFQGQDGGSEFGVPRNLQLMLVGLAFSTFLLFIRAIYRTAEVSSF